MEGRGRVRWMTRQRETDRQTDNDGGISTGNGWVHLLAIWWQTEHVKRRKAGTIREGDNYLQIGLHSIVPLSSARYWVINPTDGQPASRTDNWVVRSINRWTDGLASDKNSNELGGCQIEICVIMGCPTHWLERRFDFGGTREIKSSCWKRVHWIRSFSSSI